MVVVRRGGIAVEQSHLLTDSRIHLGSLLSVGVEGVRLLSVKAGLAQGCCGCRILLVEREFVLCCRRGGRPGACCAVVRVCASLATARWKTVMLVKDTTATVATTRSHRATWRRRGDGGSGQTWNVCAQLPELSGREARETPANQWLSGGTRLHPHRRLCAESRPMSATRLSRAGQADALRHCLLRLAWARRRLWPMIGRCRSSLRQ